MTGRIRIFTSHPAEFKVKITGRGWCGLDEFDNDEKLEPGKSIKIFRKAKATPIYVQLYVLNEYGAPTTKCEIKDCEGESIVRYLHPDHYAWMAGSDTRMVLTLASDDSDLLKDADGDAIFTNAAHAKAYFSLLFDDKAKWLEGITTQEVFMECKRISQQNPDWSDHHIVKHFRHMITTRMDGLWTKKKLGLPRTTKKGSKE